MKPKFGWLLVSSINENGCVRCQRLTVLAGDNERKWVCFDEIAEMCDILGLKQFGWMHDLTHRRSGQTVIYRFSKPCVGNWGHGDHRVRFIEVAQHCE